MRPFLPEKLYSTATWSVRTWLTALVLACLLPGVIGASVLFMHQYRMSRLQQDDDLLQKARALTQAVDNELSRTRVAAQALATSPLLADRDFARFHERARNFLSLAGLGTNVVLIDATERQILNTAVPYGVSLQVVGYGIPQKQEEAKERSARIKEAFAGKTTMTDVFTAPVFQRPIMAMFIPVTVDGKITFILGIGILTERFNTLLSSQGLPAQGVAVVLNNNGTIVGRSQGADRLVGTKALPALRRALNDSREGSLENTIQEGTPVLTMFSRSRVTNWGVAIGIPREAIAAGLWRTLTLLAAGVALLFCVGLVLARFVSSRIARSFEVLSAPATALGESMPLPVPPVHVKEAREVAEAIHRAGNLLQERAEVIRTKETELAEGHRIAKFGTWFLDLRTGEVRVSDSLRDIYGCDVPPFAEMLGNLLPAASWERLNEALQETIRTGKEHELEEQAYHASGYPLWLNFKCVAIRADNGEVSGALGTVLDTTKRRQAEEQLRASEEQMRNASLHDHLTGLPNRKLVFEYGEHVLAAARRNHSRGALLFIDLDRFKPVNDLYGHETGDRLLQEVGKRLRECTRDEDLVGRLGGDEFVIILPHLEHGHQRSEAVARHVIDSLSRPFRVDALELSISPSIGISCFPEHATDMNTLIHTADLAMYQVKRSGRARYQHYADEFDQRAGEALRVEERLRRALKHDGLRLYYQPVVDIDSERLVGAEALLRLDDGGTAIGPDRFIPIAESAGLIGLLGDWVANEACRQHVAWRAQGLDLAIAINVSPLQFRQPAFADQLSRILADSGMDPASLEIEVTESTVMENLDAAVRILNRIKALGVKVALDDFGTGYSSLSTLCDLPLDKLKIDKSFVQHLQVNHASRAVTEAIVTLGRSLQLKIHAEGIESASALQQLQELGCHQAQGYWISRPLPAAEFVQWSCGHKDGRRAR